MIAKLDEIVAFSELDEFFDHPLRTYSDGMKLRLAFSVAISVDPEVLLIDEVLSVGDVRFQEKCFARLEELQEAGTTILLTSHDEGQVRELCGRAVWLARGRLRAQGDPDEVFEAYKKAMRVETERRSVALEAEHWHAQNDPHLQENRFGTREVEIVGVRVEPQEIRPAGATGQMPVRIEIDLDPHVDVEEPIVGVSLHRLSDGASVLNLSTEGDAIRLGTLAAPRTIALTVDRLDVEPGSYRFDVGVYERDWSYVYDYHWQAYPLEVRRVGSGFGPSRRWDER